MKKVTVNDNDKSVNNANGNCSAFETMQEDNKFLANMMLIKFSPTNYCLSSHERKKLEDCYNRAFAKSTPS